MIMVSDSAIGLDWEGVVTEYATAFSELVKNFKQCVIITQKKSLTKEDVLRFLNLDNANFIIEICPEERAVDYQTWKAEMCLKHNVIIMFDDDPTVIMECQRKNIPAVLIGKIPSYMLNI